MELKLLNVPADTGIVTLPVGTMSFAIEGYYSNYFRYRYQESGPYFMVRSMIFHNFIALAAPLTLYFELPIAQNLVISIIRNGNMGECSLRGSTALGGSPP